MRIREPLRWQSRRRGRSRPVVAAVAGAWLLACASVPPEAPPLADFAAVRRKDDVIRFTGFAPTRCTWSRPGNELCSWRLANRNGAWWTLAPTLPTEYQLNLVCEFPSDGSPRAKPCAIYPRKSRPFTATAPVAAAGSDAERSYRAPAPEGEGDLAREEAQRALDAVGTVREVVELVGDAPDLCVRVGERSRECVWNAGNQAQGYELLAATIDTDERVQLHCTFPEDGSPRAAGSCRIDAP